MERNSGKKGKVTRRELLKGGAVAGIGAGVLGLTGCGSNNSSDKDLVYPNQDKSATRWGFLIDLTKCTGCTACAVACKTENDVRLGVFRNGVISYDSGTYPNVSRDFVPWLCNHCADPNCIKVCPVEPIKSVLTFSDGTKAEYWAKATYQRPDGLVLVDQDRCVGCGKCVSACPYKARFLDPAKTAGSDPESVGLSVSNPKAVDKCNLCVHRLAKGVVPACVNTCPANARMVGNLNDSSSEISQKIASAGSNVTVLKSEYGTDPRCYYIGLNSDAYSNGTEARTDAGLQSSVPTLS